MFKENDSPLFQAAVMTFEQLGFLLPDLEEEKMTGTVAGTTAQVKFSGPFDGRLLVTLSRELLPVMTGNMLGEDDIPSLQQQNDALGELANVVCGNTLPLIAGAKEIFHLSAPEILENGQSPMAEDGAMASRVYLSFMDGQAELRLFIDPAGQKRLAQ